MKRTLLVAVVVLGWVGGAALTPAAGAAESAAAAKSTAAVEPTVVAEPADPDSVATAAGSPVQANETEFPPGLSEEGVTDPLALAEAHQQALDNESYTMSTTFAYRTLNGTVLGQGATATRVAPGGESYYSVTSQRNENASETLEGDTYDIEVWANETGAAVARNVPDSEITYELQDRSNAPMSPNSQWETLYSAFATTNTTLVGEVERDGTTLYKIASTSPTDEAVAGQTSDFTALVDADGVVRSFQMTQRTTIDDEQATFTTTFHVTQIGNTTVEQPDWYDQAVENGTL